ncbi:MAG: hypothetical protein KAX49_03670 [Halanaerobiales bacterium]|nr:hypothetical protein [Halanaerobiales bacterium]
MIAPVSRLTKKEITWLANHRCKHGHTYLEHYNCYLEENPKGFKMGFFDIETSGLKADFGLMYCYCIKEHGKKEIIGRTITQEELRSDELDKGVVENCIKDMSKFDVLVTHYGCVTPGHRVLTANLEWKPVENLEIGEKLLTFNEEPKRDSNYRCYEEGTVLENRRFTAEAYEVELSDGRKLVSTPDHLWLTESGWVRTDRLKAINVEKQSNYSTKIKQFLPVWKTRDSYEAGWLSGFFDGEGSLSKFERSDKKGDYRISIIASQNTNIALETAFQYLNKEGFKYGVHWNYDKHNEHTKEGSECNQIVLSKTISEMLTFLGAVRPKRLLDKFNAKMLEDFTLQSRPSQKFAIKSVKHVGQREFIGLGTTSKTYFVEGFGAHNTRFDIPFVRSRALHWKIPFPAFGAINHKDTYYMCRRLLCITRNRLETACQAVLGVTKKTHMNPDIWVRALQGKTDALEFIYDHCERDVEDLEDLYLALLGFVKDTSKSI